MFSRCDSISSINHGIGHFEIGSKYSSSKDFNRTILLLKIPIEMYPSESCNDYIIEGVCLSRYTEKKSD